MTDAAQSHSTLDPSTYAVVFSTSHLLRRAVSDSAHISLNEYRILSRIVSSRETFGSAIAQTLDLPRNMVSMGLAALKDKQLIGCRNEDDKKTVFPTKAGDQRYRIAHDAARMAILNDLPIMLASERKTASHYMVMMADRLGAPIMSNSEIDLTHLMVETNSRVKRIMKRCATRHSLSSSGFLILSGLLYDASAKKARPSDLAERTRLDKPDVTRTCRGLEDAGFVTIADDPQDKRSRIVSCTPEGESAFGAACRDFWDEFSSKVRALSNEEFAFFTDINTRRR